MTTEAIDPVAHDSGTDGASSPSRFNDAVAAAQAKFSETAKALRENEKIIAAQTKLAAKTKALRENEKVVAAQAKLAEKTKAAQEALKGHAETFRTQTKSYRENAGQQFDDAQRQLVAAIKERPVTATLTGLGLGLLLGMLLSNRGK